MKILENFMMKFLIFFIIKLLIFIGIFCEERLRVGCQNDEKVVEMLKT